MAAYLDLKVISTRKRNEATLHIIGGGDVPPIAVTSVPYVHEDHSPLVLGSREMGADTGGLYQGGNPHPVLYCLGKQPGHSTLVHLSPIHQSGRDIYSATPEIMRAVAQYDCCKVIWANMDRGTTKYDLRFYKQCNPHFAMGLVLPYGTESAVEWVFHYAR